MKKMITLLLVLAVIMGMTMVVSAAEATPVVMAAKGDPVYVMVTGACGDNLSWTLMSNGKLTISGTGSMSDNRPWYPYSSQITEVVIEEGVTSIARSAFSYYDNNLTTVSLPSTLETIGDWAFEYCEKLTTIKIPAGVTYISSSAFDYCTAITGFWVDAGNANYCNDASGVLYNKDKTELVFCPRVFSGSYEIPSGVTIIKDSAFSGCKGLTEITIPNTVITIEGSAFSDCTALKNFTIPDSVETIGYSAFRRCISLTSVVIPDSVVSLGGNCFNCCDMLTSVTIGKSVVSIGGYAFYQSPVSKVIFKGDAPEVGSDVFWCPRPDIEYYLISVTAYYPAGNDTWTDEAFESFRNDGIRVTGFTWLPYGEDEEEESADLVVSGVCGDDLSWTLMSNGKLIISGTGSMYDNSPWEGYRSQITKVVVEEGVTGIGNSAFSGCGLTSVSLPSTLKTIGDFAFKYCRELLSIKIPASVTSISGSAFADCDAMTEVLVEKGSANYCNDASGVLYNKDKTELVFCPRDLPYSYEIPSTVKIIAPYAFHNCKSLTSMVIPGSVVILGDYSFAGCKNLSAVTMGNGLVSMGGYAFKGCDSLKGVKLPDSLVNMGSYAFWGCESLKEVKLPDNLVSISDNCFLLCDALGSITIPKKVSHIGYNAFLGCSLWEIKFEGNAPVIDPPLFYKIQSIDVIIAYYPAGDTTWTDEVFNSGYSEGVNDIKWVSYAPDVEEEEEAPVYIVAQGSCGSNVGWMIKSDGRLIIYGTGAMQFMMRSGAAPWSAYADLITSVEVSSGVESIADNAFAGCRNLTTISVADTVKSIGNEAFAGCESLKTVTFAGDAPEIGENCFEDTSFNVQYPKNNATWTEKVQEDFGQDVVWVEENCAHSFGAPVVENAVKATCTENGSYEEVKTCSACGKVFRDTIIVNATGHTFDQEKIDQKYLVSELSSDSLAVYRKSCKCGSAGEETFEVNPKEFRDVPKNAFYYDPVMWAVEKGITTGTGEGKFSPDAICNRGQVVTFLWRAAGQPEPTKTENPFKDVKSGDFFYKAVLWAAEQGITTGTSETTFSPNENCNRGQIVTFLSRAKGGKATTSTNPFKDVAENAFYYNPVLWAVEKGITAGTGDGTTFEPNAACTRGQVITFLYRAYK